MYRQLLFALAISAGAFTAIAQPTITAADYSYVAGDRYIQYLATQVPAPGAGGNNVTWDFSGMTSTVSDTFTAMACTATPYCSTFPGSTVAATYTSQGPSYSYYIADANRFAMNGIRQHVPQYSIDVTMNYVEPEDLIRYPFTTTTSYRDSFATVYTTNGYPYLRRGHIDVSSDGYGTLILPGGKTYKNVIRIVRRETYNDSTNFGTGPQYNYYTSVIYEWRQPGTRVMLMSRDSLKMTLFTQQVSYSVSARYATPFPAAVANVSETISDITVFPNPVRDMVNVKFNTGNDHVKISLVDMIGREIAVLANKTFTSGTHTVSYSTSSLARGIYLLRMQTGNGVATRKVEIQ